MTKREHELSQALSECRNLLKVYPSVRSAILNKQPPDHTIIDSRRLDEEAYKNAYIRSENNPVNTPELVREQRDYLLRKLRDADHRIAHLESRFWYVFYGTALALTVIYSIACEFY